MPFVYIRDLSFVYIRGSDMMFHLDTLNSETLNPLNLIRVIRGLNIRVHSWSITETSLYRLPELFRNRLFFRYQASILLSRTWEL